MLIPSPRHRPEDLALWAAHEEADRFIGASTYRSQQAADAILSFVAAGPCYASVSWGKDSVVMAHLLSVHAPHVPLVWIRVEPIKNPECELVHDAYHTRFPAQPYHEIEVWCQRGLYDWHASGTLEKGFAQAVERFGNRHISGIRADESGTRKIVIRTLGLSGDNTCRPIGYWSTAQVYGYLSAHDLPIHPAYAMLGNGRYAREHLRVASLGGVRGAGMGRAEWESEYYGDVLRRLTSV